MSLHYLDDQTEKKSVFVYFFIKKAEQEQNISGFTPHYTKINKQVLHNTVDV